MMFSKRILYLKNGPFVGLFEERKLFVQVWRRFSHNADSKALRRCRHPTRNSSPARTLITFGDICPFGKFHFEIFFVEFQANGCHRSASGHAGKRLREPGPQFVAAGPSRPDRQRAE